MFLSEPAMTSARDNSLSHFLNSFLGCAGIFVVAGALSQITKDGLLASFLYVATSAAVIMVAFALLCHRWIQRSEEVRRFDLFSVMLAVVPLSVFLAGLNRILRRVDATNITLPGWIVFAAMASIACVVASIVLLLFANTLVRIALRVQQWTKRSKRP